MKNCIGVMLLGLALLVAASCQGVSRAEAAEDTQAQPAGEPPAAAPP